ncbi:hypothetical protein Btru_048891, partial [Bulinus truncatus]
SVTCTNCSECVVYSLTEVCCVLIENVFRAMPRKPKLRLSSCREKCLGECGNPLAYSASYSSLSARRDIDWHQAELRSARQPEDGRERDRKTRSLYDGDVDDAGDDDDDDDGDMRKIKERQQVAPCLNTSGSSLLLCLRLNLCYVQWSLCIHPSSCQTTMQVVYSGGSTSKPSPGRSGKLGYGRPVLPGYMTHVHPQVTVQRSREDRPPEQDQSLRDYIPAMHTGVAVLCLFLNVILPGTGTITAGVSLMCCSRARPAGSSKSHCMWVNIGVGAVQFFLTFIFLMGWIWSIVWGLAFLTIAREFTANENRKKKPEIAPNEHHKPKSSGTSKETGAINHQRFHNRKLLDDACPESSSLSGAFNETAPRSVNNIAAHHKPHNGRLRQQSSSNGDAYPELTGLQVTNIAQSLHHQPIIALQQITGDHLAQPQTACVPNEALMKAGTRKMKILKRKLSDNDLSPFVLTHQQLEAIVIHDLPVISASGEREEEGTVLPKSV